MRHRFAPIAVSALLLVPCVAGAGTPARDVAAESASDKGATKPKPAAVEAGAAERDRANYAAREQAAPAAQEFKGGDTVVIGASAATAILAVLLLVVLI